jgi:hypothetical protein
VAHCAPPMCNRGYAVGENRWRFCSEQSDDRDGLPPIPARQDGAPRAGRLHLALSNTHF